MGQPPCRDPTRLDHRRCDGCRAATCRHPLAQPLHAALRGCRLGSPSRRPSRRGTGDIRHRRCCWWDFWAVSTTPNGLRPPGSARARGPDAPDTISCWIGLIMSRIGRRESGRIGEAAKAAHQTSGLGTFGDAIMSAAIAGQEATDDPSGAAEWAHRAETLIVGRRNPALSADVLSNLALYYGLAGDPARGVECCREALALARNSPGAHQCVDRTRHARSSRRHGRRRRPRLPSCATPSARPTATGSGPRSG